LSQVAVLDIGTGAGFPAVPLAIMCPDWTIVAIDGTSKKAGFVATVALEIGLKNLTVEHAHSDHWPSTRKFDLVTTRAVASLAKCMRSAHPRLKQGGRLVAYKSAVLPDEETQEAKTAGTELGMEIEPPFVYELRLGDELLKRALRPVRRIR
jgi:16S rRNA (guanine527-N7)-methyltransferase